MSRPRICILTSEYSPVRGGIATYARQVGLAASQLGADVTLWAPDYGASDHPTVEEEGMQVRRFSGGPHSFRDVHRKFAATWRAAQPGYDIIHAADWPFYLWVTTLPRRLGARRLVTLHGSELNQMARPARRALLNSVGWTANVDGFVCNSRFTRDLLVDIFPAARNRTSVVTLGVSRFWLGETREREVLRAEAGLGPGDLAVITVGRLTPRKGHLETLEALSRLPQALRDRVVWLVVGPAIDADYARALKSASERAPIRVKLLGERPNEELRGLFRAADLFCLTSRPTGGAVEGFGLVYLEAGAGGLPAIATRVGGVPDAVLDGSTGILVGPGSIEESAEAIERCLGNDSLRRRLGDGARAYSEELSWQRCAAQTYDLPIQAGG